MLTKDKKVDIGEIVYEQIELAVSKIQSESVDFIVIKQDKENDDVYISRVYQTPVGVKGKINYEKLFDYLNKIKVMKSDYSYSNLEKENNFVEEEKVKEGYELAETINFNRFMSRLLFGSEFDMFSSIREKEEFDLENITAQKRFLNMINYSLMCC